MDFDKILTHLGDFGRYQKFLYFLVCLPAVFTGIFAVISAIILATPDHRCKIPGYENDTYSIQSDRHREVISNYIPPPAANSHLYDQCHTYSFNHSSVMFDTLGRPINGSTVKCDEWVYSYSVFKQTFTSKFNLVCSNSYKTSLAKSSYFVGIFVGAMVFGNLSDAIGRKTVFCISVAIQFVATVTLAWAPNTIVMYIYLYDPDRALVGRNVYCCIRLELVGPSKRIYTGIVVDYFFAVGLVLLSGVAYLVRHWKYIDLMCALPIGLFLFYWWILPESPRWLISKKRYKEAKAILLRAAKYNNVVVSEYLFSQDIPVQLPQKDEKYGRLWHLFTTKVLLTRTLVIFFNWGVVNMVYYGLSLNSGNLEGNYYLNFLLSGLVEFPAYTLTLLLLDRLGRKWLYIICMILGGVSCISTIFTILYLEERYQPVTIALAMLGKLGAAGAFGIIYTYSAELFPTVVRNAGMGASSCISRIGAIAAPYIADSGNYIGGSTGKAFPLAVFGSLSILAGLLSLHLPETMGQELPETIEDGIQFGTPTYKSKADANTKTYMNSTYVSTDACPLETDSQSLSE
ncbi:Organic cation transporter protein [Mizuhopecten yessoensis]|uniref:Organic cation transporter protein n=1 Tax=Mizuhopecten yessoensis TaxID=6573 RepID=A0A210QB07_MIZYE|nr:Organic cation transporter protein [Mizuhopecten yessoensis]